MARQGGDQRLRRRRPGKPRKQQPSNPPYRSEFFGTGPDDGPSAGWLAAIAAVLGLLLVGGAVAVHKGVNMETLRRMGSGSPGQ